MNSLTTLFANISVNVTKLVNHKTVHANAKQ